jgi:hypothetical protein
MILTKLKIKNRKIIKNLMEKVNLILKVGIK